MPEHQPLQEQDLEWNTQRYKEKPDFWEEANPVKNRCAEKPGASQDRWVGFVGRVGGAGSEMSSVKHRPREKQGVGSDWQEDSGGIKRHRQMSMRQSETSHRAMAGLAGPDTAMGLRGRQTCGQEG